MNSDEAPTIPIGPDAYTSWDRWWLQRIGVRAYMRSTYDRTGHNNTADASHYLYQEAETFNVTLDVDNGSGGHTATFYYRTDTDQSLSTHTGWTQLGTPVIASGISSIRPGNTQLVLGAHVNGNREFWAGNYYRALILNGIGAAGTAAADPDFTTTDQLTSTPPNYATWRDGQTNTWTLAGNSSYIPGAE